MKEINVIIRTFLFLLGSSCAALACHLVCLGFELYTPSQHSSQPDLHCMKTADLPCIVDTNINLQFESCMHNYFVIVVT
jgi:hypothetical protein